jgi:hypothetical protein
MLLIISQNVRKNLNKILMFARYHYCLLSILFMYCAGSAYGPYFTDKNASNA